MFHIYVRCDLHKSPNIVRRRNVGAQTRNSYTVLVGKTLGRTRTSEDNIKMDRVMTADRIGSGTCPMTGLSNMFNILDILPDSKSVTCVCVFR
jgi:hypothetical protein